MESISKQLQRMLAKPSVRYLISGGTATAVDIGSYFLMIHYVFKSPYVNVASLKMASPMVALAVSYSLGFVTSFSFTKFFVFKEAQGKTRYQLLRFASVALMVFVLNYLIMKVLIFALHVFPTVSRIISAAMVAIVSYMIHKHFTFRNRS